MKKFFHPRRLAVFGVADDQRNLGRTIINNCQKFGFEGEIVPVGQIPGRVFGLDIVVDPADIPDGIDLAVVLVPARAVADVMETCGRKGIRRAVVSTGGYAEFQDRGNRHQEALVATARRWGIRFIGPNCIGVICPSSGLCTPFNPLRPAAYKPGRVAIVAQSGGVATQAGYYYSEEHVGFSKIISVGNKLDLTEADFIEYLMEDEETDQIHLYLESIVDGRRLMDQARRSPKPLVVFKSNISRTAAKVAQSHTAALSNDDRVVSGALCQAGIVRADGLHDLTVCAKALRLPPLRGDRLAAVSLSGGFAVILGDACEKYGFRCPPLPRPLIDQIESKRRGGIIRMANPMDFGDVHDIVVLSFALESLLALEDIDGLVLSFMYSPEMAVMFSRVMDRPELVLDFFKMLTVKYGKPVALSFFGERGDIEVFKQADAFPVFNDPVESVRALSALREWWRRRTGGEHVDYRNRPEARADHAVRI